MVLGVGVAPTFQVLTQRLITFSNSEEETFNSYEWDLLVPCFSINWLQWQKLMSHHPRPHSNGWLLLTHYIAEPLLYLSHYHLNTFIVLSFTEYKASVVSISLQIRPTLSFFILWSFWPESGHLFTWAAIRVGDVKYSLSFKLLKQWYCRNQSSIKILNC